MKNNQKQLVQLNCYEATVNTPGRHTAEEKEASIDFEKVIMLRTHIYQKTSINTIISGNAYITKP